MPEQIKHYLTDLSGSKAAKVPLLLCISKTDDWIVWLQMVTRIVGVDITVIAHLCLKLQGQRSGWSVFLRRGLEGGSLCMYNLLWLNIDLQLRFPFCVFRWLTFYDDMSIAFIVRTQICVIICSIPGQKLSFIWKQRCGLCLLSNIRTINYNYIYLKIMDICRWVWNPAF